MPQPASLMDMFSGNAPLEFSPRDYAGNQIGMGDAIAQNSNSLVGLGMGLLQPYRPGESPYANALQGFQAGSVADSRRGYQQAQLQHQKRQEARQAANDAFTRSQAGITDAQRAMKDVLGADATPEQKATFMKQYYSPKTEGDWQIVQAPHPTYPGETVPVWANKRTRETQPFTGQPAPTTATDPFTAGTGQRVYGTGGDYSTPAAPTTGSAAPAPSSDEAIPPAPPGSDPKEWRKEQTKLLVQRRTAAEAAKRAGASIDPVTEDIDRALAQISKYPAMTTGGFSSVLKKIPIVGSSSQAGEVESLINTVKASSSLEKLQQMRAQSPTGASGLGAVTQGEHKLLQDSIGALDQSQDAQSVLYNLERVKRIRHEIIHGPGTAPPPKYAPPSYQQTPGATTGGKAVDKKTIGGKSYSKIGGQWFED